MGAPDLKWLYLCSVTPNKKLLNSNVTKRRKTIDKFWRKSYCDIIIIIIFAEGPTGKTIMNGANALLKKLLKSNKTKQHQTKDTFEEGIAVTSSSLQRV